MESPDEQDVRGDILEAVGTEVETATQRPARRLLLIGLAGAALLAVACAGLAGYFVLGYFRLGFRLPIPPAAVLKSPASSEEPFYNRIAFAGNDDNIWLVAPDGQDMLQVTSDNQDYRQPTWSPDSRYLAFIGSKGDNKAVLYTTPASHSAPVSLFDNPDSAPFYLYWSPDSQGLTFLTQEADNLKLRRVEVSRPGIDRVLGEGSPFYWVWSPAGDKLLMHVGGSRALSANAHLSILPNLANAQRVELKFPPGGFQAPVWSADGQYVYFVATSGPSQDAIYRMDQETLQEQQIADVSGFAFMVLSPTGKQVAYVQIEQADRAPFGTAYIVDGDGQNRHRLTEEPVGSIYWSPDGTKLALLTLARPSDGATAKVPGLASPLPQELFFRWWIYHVDTQALEALISFHPTLDFLQTVPYFDQYHLSLTFWSPDSRYLVLTRENSGHHTGTVWVADTTGVEEPRQIGEGTMAVWSWR